MKDRRPTASKTKPRTSRPLIHNPTKKNWRWMRFAESDRAYPGPGSTLSLYLLDRGDLISVEEEVDSIRFDDAAEHLTHRVNVGDGDAAILVLGHRPHPREEYGVGDGKQIIGSVGRIPGWARAQVLAEDD